MHARRNHPDSNERTALIAAALRGFLTGASRAVISWLLNLWDEGD